MADLPVKVGTDTSGFATGLAKMENMAAGFGRNLGGILAGAFSFNAIAQQFSAALSQAGQLQDLSDAFGVSAEAIQRIGNAAAESGGSLQDVGRALAKIGLGAQQAFNGNEQLASSFAAIGVSGQDLINLSPEQLFYRLAAAMNDGTLAGKDLAVAKDLLGRGFTTLMPVLKMTEEQIRAVGEAAGIMSDDAVAKLDSFGDSWGRLSNRVKVRAAEIIDASIRLGEEVMANPMSLFGDWQEIEKRIDARQKRDREAREAMRNLRPEEGDVLDNAAQTEKERQQAVEKSIRAQERAKNDLLKAEERYRDAVREREGRTLDATQQIGRAEAEIIDLQTQASALAENTAEKYELLAEIEKKRGEVMDLNNRRAEDAARLAEQEARAQERATQARQDFEGLTAELAGPKAELALQRRRTREAGQRARETGNVDDAVAAQRETLRLAQMETTRLRDAAFDDEDARRRGVRLAESARGVLPADAFTGNMQQVAQAIGQAVRDTAFDDEDAQQNPDGAKDGTVDTVRTREAGQRETLRLAQMESTRLRDTAFDDEDARRRGVRLAESALGVMPADAFTGNMQQVAQAIGQAVRDTALTNMPTVINPDGAKDGTVDEVRARVQECVDRLDQIIRLSGTFTY